EETQHRLARRQGVRVALFRVFCRGRLRLPLELWPFHQALGSERLTAPAQLVANDLDTVAFAPLVGPLTPTPLPPGERGRGEGAERRFQFLAGHVAAPVSNP